MATRLATAIAFSFVPFAASEAKRRGPIRRPWRRAGYGVRIGGQAWGPSR